VFGGASDRPSVRERLERASEAADSAVVLRHVGTGGSLAGNEGVTVRCTVVDIEAAGLAGAVVVVVEGFAGVADGDVGFAAVEVVAAALGVVGVQAARRADEVKLRRSREKPLRAGFVAMLSQ
jgi:hypothetical protein